VRRQVRVVAGSENDEVTVFDGLTGRLLHRLACQSKGSSVITFQAAQVRAHGSIIARPRTGLA
jgi:hypothetical protein